MNDTSFERSSSKGPALVFGASGEQGRAVVEGMFDSGYHPVYAFSHADAISTSRTSAEKTYLTDALGATIFPGNLENPDDVLKALLTTRAQAIFLVTTTDLPSEPHVTCGFSDAVEAEYQVIVTFFRLLKQAYQQDGLPRHVVFSVRDNVDKVVKEHFFRTGETWMEPLDDGSIVPHYSAKGRGGEYAMEFLKDTKELKLTLLTLPFLFSNFLGFFCPLPDESQTQWTLSACFGDGSKPIDMIGTLDLEVIVPFIFDNPKHYAQKNLRLVGERITMDKIAATFEDLFGKPVIYNPLTYEEVVALPFAAAPAMAQMCKFASDPRSLAHDLDLTKEVLNGKVPQTFEDWLLTHSESSAFQASGLTADAPEIESVAVFGSTSPEGISVVKGLLADPRKKFTIRATSRRIDSEEAKKVKTLNKELVTMVEVDLDNKQSIREAVEGVDGVFLMTHFLQEDHTKDLGVEERHVRDVIDACEAAHSVKHLIFSTLESVDVLHHMDSQKDLGFERSYAEEQFNARTRCAAYAKTAKLSVTFVLLPYYSEAFLDKISTVSETSPRRVIFDMPSPKKSSKVVCMSIDDLGEAVSNIFDSYQVYAGHEIGLVTDLVSFSEVKQIFEDRVQAAENSVDSSINEEKDGGDRYEAGDTYMKDFGQLFGHLAHSDAVKARKSIATTMKLVPSARPLREWIEMNLDNEAFREKLGLR